MTLHSFRFAFLLLFAFATVLPKRESVSASDDTKPNQIIYLGTGGGKAFFFDDTRDVNWTTASEKCRAAQMELASIETISQTEFLVEALRELNQTGYFYTSGREDQRPSSFVWNNTRESLTAEVVTPFDQVPDMYPNYYYCITLEVNMNAYHYHAGACSKLLQGALCQI